MESTVNLEMKEYTKKNDFIWEVGYCPEENAVPEVFFPATVPGAVQLDYANAHGWKPYWEEKDPSIYGWMEDVYWLYRTELTVPEEGGAVLVFKGIDYQYRICLDEDVLCEGEGMFRELRLDVARYAGRHCRLEVLLWPIPKAPIVWEGRDQVRESCKPGVSYGWDFHPRLVPTGLWDEVYLEWGAPVSLLSCAPAPTVSEDLSSGTVEVSLCLSGEAVVRLELLDSCGCCVAADTCRTTGNELHTVLAVEQPDLWWPVGYGEQPLYTLRLLLAGTETCLYEKRLGFRRVSLSMNQGEWDFPNTFPKTRSTAPITLTVNGLKIFAKGSNWVPPDVFFGRITEQTYEKLLSLVRGANMNILRVWGGGIINKDPFFEICDRLGIMVWQEFPLACNEYPDKPAYLRVLEQEAVGIIHRLRLHPCVVLWCGGNELFNSWSHMTDQHHALRLLNKLCYEHDRHTPFLMTSPLFGMAHGHYRHLDAPATEFITKMPDQTNTAYTEFGVPGCNSLSYILAYCSKEEFEACRSAADLEKLLPFHADPVLKKLSSAALCHYYGEEGTPRQAIERMALLQGMLYKSMFEEMRKQWPRCSMAINWCFDSPWPLLCSENVVDWPCEPKPAYEEIRQALRGQLASLRIRRHVYAGGSDFRAEVWLLNDTLDCMSSLTIEVIGRYEGHEKVLLVWQTDSTPAQTNQQGPSVYWKLPDRGEEEMFTIELRCCKQPEVGSIYRYILRSAADYHKVITLNDL